MDFGHPSDPNQQLRYDGQGNMTRETASTSGAVPSSIAGITSYGYDGNDRLNSENSSRFSSYARSYSLDAAYNRTASTGVNGSSASWSNLYYGNSNNQVMGVATTQSGVTTNTGYTYDGEGNRSSLTSGNTVTGYGYDSQQRLTAVTQSVNGAAATAVLKCGYRADGLRAWKENAQGRTYFLYDGSMLVGEFDSMGTMQASQTWGAEGLAYRRTASGASAGTRFYSWDVRGNVAATTDASGAVLNTPSSDGFSSSGGVEPCATFGGQVGGYRDAETGLVLFGQRYYDQGLGSWLTRDPIGEAGGVNLYSYVQGNPVGWVDSDGLNPKRTCPQIAADIFGRVGEIALRIEQMRVDKYHLYDFRNTPTGLNPEFPHAKTWDSHIDQLQKQRANLNKLIDEWVDSGCGQGGNPPPAHAWKWLTAPTPTRPRREENKIQAGSSPSYSIPRIDPNYSNAQTAAWLAAMMAALAAASRAVAR